MWKHGSDGRHPVVGNAPALMVRAVAFLELKHCKLREVKFGMAEVVHGDGRRATFEALGRALRRPKPMRLRGEDEARGRLWQLVLVA